MVETRPKAFPSFSPRRVVEDVRNFSNKKIVTIYADYCLSETLSEPRRNFIGGWSQRYLTPV